jgi:hypothetical protein
MSSDEASECDNCTQLQRFYTAKINIINSHLDSTQKECEMWKKKCAEAERRLENLGTDEINFADVDSDYCHPSELQIPAFENYLLTLTANFPFLSILLALYLSSSHKRKLNSSSTKQQWIHWSFFYRSFICDMLLKSRAPKAVRRTHLLLSTYFLLTNLSESSWRLLQRLKIIVSKAVVEKWVMKFGDVKISEKFVLILSLDNCDFFKHKSHITSLNRSNYIHIITSFIVEIPLVVDIPTSAIWNYVNRAEFGN